MKKKHLLRSIAAGMALAMLLLPGSYAMAAEEIEPHEASYGFYADTYTENVSSNTDTVSNPAIGLLSGFLKLWKPGNAWHNGKILNEAIIRANIEKSYEIARNRTEEEAQKSYEIEVGNANWISLEGLGEYKEAFIELSGLGDNTSQWIPDKQMPMFYAAHIVRFMRSTASSTTPAKNFYAFPRPYRWNIDTIEVLNGGFDASILVDQIQEVEDVATLNPSSDGGFPSGHTNAIFLTTYGLTYAVPQKFHELLMNAAEGGHYRIVAAVHSPLDVMGGRMTATALAASIFADKESSNASIMVNAYNEAQANLFPDVVPAVATLADYEEYQKNLEQFIYYLTYDFEQIGATDAAMRVPKGAEAMLETRLPYLTDEQRRYVIYTTGLESGYPLLDDEEGWGRINYYKAAAGYGAFVTDVTVEMDASLGAFNACDSWLNDISGPGSLTKMGTGTLGLAGNNTFTGGVTVKGGELVMVSGQALGTGNVQVADGILSETVSGAANITGNYEQTGGTLKLTVGSAEDVLGIAGDAVLGGKLVIELAEGFEPANGTAVLNAKSITGSFSAIEIVGTASGYSAAVSGNAIVLSKAEPTPVPTTEPTITEAPALEEPADNTALYVVIAIAAAAVVVVIVVLVLKKKSVK